MRTRLNSFGKMIVLLSVLATILVVANMSDGIRVRRVLFDNTATASLSPRVIIETNRRLEEVSVEQISVIPEREFVAKTVGSSVIIEFKGALDYGQEYEVKLFSVKGVNSNASATLTADFSTRSARLFYLDRNDEYETDTTENDQIIESTVDGSKTKVLYSAPKITEFTLVGERIAALVLDENSHHTMILKEANSDSAEAIELPGDGTASLLKANNDGTVVGFSFVDEALPPGERYPRLYFYDLEAKIFFSIKGLDGNYVGTYSWQFAPDGETVAIVTTNGDLIGANINDEEIVPFGMASDVMGFSGDGSALYVQDNLKPYEIRLGDGFRRSMDELEQLGGRALSAVPAPLRSQIIFGKIGDYGLGGDYSIRIVALSNNDLRLIAALDSRKMALVGYTASYNGQYVFLEVSDLESSTYDNYPVRNAPKNVKTLIYDTFSGSLVGEVPGFMPLSP